MEMFCFVSFSAILLALLVQEAWNLSKPNYIYYILISTHWPARKHFSFSWTVTRWRSASYFWQTMQLSVDTRWKEHTSTNVTEISGKKTSTFWCEDFVIILLYQAENNLSKLSWVEDCRRKQSSWVFMCSCSGVHLSSPNPFRMLCAFISWAIRCRVPTAPGKPG